MTPTPVGMRCPECSRERTRVHRMRTGPSAPVATQAIIAINVVVYLAQLATGGGFGDVGGSVYREGALYGRYWGCTRELPFLHFEVCYYHSIEDAIARKLSRFEPGAGGSHKVSRGFAPTITHSAHHLHNARFDLAIREFLDRERCAIDEAVAEGRAVFRR